MFLHNFTALKRPNRSQRVMTYVNCLIRKEPRHRQKSTQRWNGSANGAPSATENFICQCNYEGKFPAISRTNT